MAINWLVALKAVPWGELVHAAPNIVKGARKLFNAARDSEPPPVGPAEADEGGDATSVHARLRRLEAALQAYDREQDSTAELLRSLAEQNARVVAAIEVLRARSRLMLGVAIGLAAAYVVLAVWVMTR